MDGEPILAVWHGLDGECIALVWWGLAYRPRKAATYYHPQKETMTTSSPDTAPTWSIIDNNDALWQITIIDYATNRMTTHYLIAEGEALGHQDILDLYFAHPAILAKALNLPKKIGTKFDLVGLMKLGLVNAIG